MNKYKFKHFYKNKYLISLLGKNKYYISYNYKYKCLWFRVAKVASRSINQHFIDNTPEGQYIYSSEVGYLPSDFKDYMKFSFVRDPLDRFVSCWKNKVLYDNMYAFDEQTHTQMKEIHHFINWVKGQDINKTADEHLRSQHSLIDLNNLDFLGRFENFDQDLEILSKKIGLPLKEAHKMNPSGSKKVELSDADIKQIKSIYELDYRLFYPDQL